MITVACWPRCVPLGLLPGTGGHALPLAPQGLLYRQNRFLGPRKPLYSELSGSHPTLRRKAALFSPFLHLELLPVFTFFVCS